MKGDCTVRPAGGVQHVVGDDSQMKGDCTQIFCARQPPTVGDDSQMKGDCTRWNAGMANVTLEMTPK